MGQGGGGGWGAGGWRGAAGSGIAAAGSCHWSTLPATWIGEHVGRQVEKQVEIGSG